LESGESVLETAETDFVQHGGSSWCLPTEAIPAALLSIKTLPFKPSAIN